MVQEAFERMKDKKEKKAARQVLRESEEQYRFLFNGITDAVYVHEVSVGKPGKFIAVNNSACSMLGYTMDEFLQMEVKDIDTPEQSEKIPSIHEKLYRDGYALFETCHVVKDGRRIPVEVNIKLFELQGKSMVLSVARDISERKRAEEALNESEKRFKDLFENSNDLIQIVDAEGKYLYVNRKWREILGFTEEETKRLHFTDIVKKEQIPHCMENFRRIANGESIEQMEIIYVSKDARELYLEGNMSPSFKDGKFVSCRGIFRDITERKKAEEALRASEAELHDNYFTQSAINMILSESLENIPLEEFLQKALNMILSIPWIAFESIGSISLVEDEPDVLVMKAQYNLPEPLKKSCAHVPFGKCLCGKAAQTQKIQFADHIDERHDICYEGMPPHGHYAVPILFGGRTLGVHKYLFKRRAHQRSKRGRIPAHCCRYAGWNHCKKTGRG